MRITFQHAGASVSATIVNLGVGGAFIEAMSIPSYAEAVTLDLSLPGFPGQFHLPAIVRWRNATGFGVQFGQLGARETHAIGELLGGWRHQNDEREKSAYEEGHSKSVPPP